MSGYVDDYDYETSFSAVKFCNIFICLELDADLISAVSLLYFVKRL